LPVGHDVCFAAAWRKRYRHLAAVFAAIDNAVSGSLKSATELTPVSQGAPLAQALGIRFPIIQGPMTRVSDVAEFAAAVAGAGALPMVAFALLKGDALDKLLAKTTELLGERAWGIGLLGFAPQSLLDEQLAIAIRYKPDYAIIAGGRPDQAVKLEASGVPTFLHVPSANLIRSSSRKERAASSSRAANAAATSGRCRASCSGRRWSTSCKTRSMRRRRRPKSCSSSSPAASTTPSRRPWCR